MLQMRRCPGCSSWILWSSLKLPDYHWPLRVDSCALEHPIPQDGLASKMAQNWLVSIRTFRPGDVKISRIYVYVYQLTVSKVAYTAWRQARDAYAIGKKLQGYLYGDKSTKRHPWTSMHGFYAIMGGFAFDTELTGQRIMPGGRTRLTLTPRGIEYREA